AGQLQENLQRQPVVCGRPKPLRHAYGHGEERFPTFTFLLLPPCFALTCVCLPYRPSRNLLVWLSGTSFHVCIHSALPSSVVDGADRPARGRPGPVLGAAQ